MSDLPKVLQPLCGRPLIHYVVESLKNSGIREIIVVVGYRGDDVKKALAVSGVSFVWQREQLGTGHAVMQAESELKNHHGRVIIACGDVPLIRPETFSGLVRDSLGEGVKAVVLTMKPGNPAGYGRIVRDGGGNFTGIVEEKDASPQEKLIGEVNSGTYIFNTELLFKGLKTINTDNAQKEYYLPDALRYVLKSGYTVKTLLLENPVEGSGVNTRDELMALEKYINDRH